MHISTIRLAALAACLGIAAGTALATAPAAVATPITQAENQAKKAKPKVHQITGEVVSVSETSLVISHVKGKTKRQMTFELTAETQKQGDIAETKRVTVYYTEEAGKMTATRIHEVTAKPKK